MMRTAVLTAAFLLGLTGVSLADEAASEQETASVTQALAAFNCKIGDVAVEKEDDGIFEIDDAVCTGGQYDIKVNEDFTVRSMTGD